MSELRHEALTGVLRGLIFKVRNELSGGWSEEVYHQALLRLLQENNIPVVSKPRRSLWHRGVEVHLFEPDLIVWDKIILELKALPYQSGFASEQYAQIIHYLKFWQKDLGLLINFAPAKVKIQRVVWDEAEFSLFESYEDILPLLSEQDKTTLRQIRQHIVTIARQYGFGYPESVYRKLVAIETAHNHLPCVTDITVVPTWRGYDLPQQLTQHLQIAEQYLINIRTLHGHPTSYDFVATKTYLNQLGFKFGLVVNFSPHKLQIFGVKAT